MGRAHRRAPRRRVGGAGLPVGHRAGLRRERRLAPALSILASSPPFPGCVRCAHQRDGRAVPGRLRRARPSRPPPATWGRRGTPSATCRARCSSAPAMASLYFVVLPGGLARDARQRPLTGDLANVLGPTFAPLLGGAAKAAALLFMVFNMFHGTLQPLAGAVADALAAGRGRPAPALPGAADPHRRALGRDRCSPRHAAIVFLLAGRPDLGGRRGEPDLPHRHRLPNVAVWLLRRNEPDLPAALPAPHGARSASASSPPASGASRRSSASSSTGCRRSCSGWRSPTPAPSLYAWRCWSRPPPGRGSDQRPVDAREAHRRDAAGARPGRRRLPARGRPAAEQREPSLVSALQDIFVAVAMLTISVGLVLPGMIAHAGSEVMRAADDLARERSCPTWRGPWRR